MGQQAELPRSKSRISRQDFELILSLTDHQPWLKLKQSALVQLIDSCDDEHEQILVCDLLKRFTYLDGDTFGDAIRKIAEHIENGLSLSTESAVISAREHSRYADSSQLVAYNLKATGGLKGEWTTNRFLSKLSDLESADADNVVLVDEFIGTGESMEKSIQYLRGKSSEWGKPFAIHCAVVAGMDFGLERVCGVADSVFSVYTLAKGISDYYSTSEVSSRITEMVRLEQTLGTTGKRGKLKKHSLGYKGSEALYARHEGNTPNNVFPIFWWEVDADGYGREGVLKCL